MAKVHGKWIYVTATNAIGHTRSSSDRQLEEFKRSWLNFSLAIKLNKKPEAVQVATLFTVVGDEAREVFTTFTDWAEDRDDAKIAPVLEKFATYCEPRKSV